MRKAERVRRAQPNLSGTHPRRTPFCACASKVLAILFLALPLAAGGHPEAGIRAVLDRQQAAWNRGDLTGFMEDYDGACVFVGATLQRGSEAVLASYQKRYPTREKMGALSFSDLEINLLARGYASVLGHWRLERATDAGGPTGGIFTLLFHYTPNGWKIILDHTS